MIREIMTSGESLEVVAENLIRAANNNGGTDNITVVLVGVRSEAAPVQRTEEPRSRELDELDALEKKMYPGTRPGF